MQMVNPSLKHCTIFLCLHEKFLHYFIKYLYSGISQALNFRTVEYIKVHKCRTLQFLDILIITAIISLFTVGGKIVNIHK